VFLEGAGVHDRLTNGEATRVLEVGLGLGHNALITAAAAQESTTSVCYVGIEHDLLPATDLEPVLQGHDSNTVAAFCQAVEAISAQHTDSSSALSLSSPSPLNPYFDLHILPVDLQHALSHLQSIPEQRFHAIYLDAFSPDVNAECWSDECLAALSQLLLPGGIIATYCAKGSVRRGLQAAGLSITRRPGPPGKRECLAASG